MSDGDRRRTATGSRRTAERQPSLPDRWTRLEQVGLAAGIGVLTVFAAIGFGIMPERFFTLGCEAGVAASTRIACFGFMWNALAVGVFVGVIGPAVGTFVVYRQMALIGETVAHAAFAGVAVGTLLLGTVGWNATLLAFALVAAVAGAVGVQQLTAHTDDHGDVPIAIVLAGSFAVGVLVLDLGGGFATVEIGSYLFGGISVTDDRSVTVMAALTLAVLGVLAVTYKQLLFVTFDEQAARVAGIAASRYNALLVALTAVVVVGAMRILGVILVAAMLVVPVAAAAQVARSFRRALYGSILVGEVSVVSGLVLAWTYGLRPGAAIVVVAVGIYLIAVVVKNARGGQAGGFGRSGSDRSP